jgi:hypothetical protein
MALRMIRLFRSMILIVAFGAAASATGQDREKAESNGDAVRSAIEARAQTYWERRQAKDLLGAYPFYCAAYRARVSQSQFLQMTRLIRFDMKETRVSSVNINDQANDKAQVTVDYKFLVPTLSAEPVSGRSTELWVLDRDGQWCKEDEPLVIPFGPPARPSGIR